MTKATNPRSGEKGFTLVELSIVMIIIGLLIGGILKGQELIANARIAAAASRVKAIDAAINTFRDSYNGLPGDLPNADTRLPSCLTSTKCGATPAGGTRGNSQIAGTTLNPGAAQASGSENIIAWAQLAAADMLGGVGNGAAAAAIIGGTTVPNADVPGQIYIGYSNGAAALTTATAAATLLPRAGHYLLYHNGVNTTAGAASSTAASGTTAVIPSNAALRMDTKLDDQRPNTGSVLAMGTTTTNTGCASATTAAAEYQASGTCGIYVRIQQ